MPDAHASTDRAATPPWKLCPACPQRQDGLQDQLSDLEAVAARLGMYDAADYIRRLRTNDFPMPGRYTS